MSKALLIVDLQNDFLPKGTLAVPHSDQIVPVINSLMPLFDFVVATKDAHPKKHVSFASTWDKKVGDIIEFEGIKQILWPDHCIQNQWGYHFPEELDQKYVDQVFYKGTNKNVDSYSIFFDQHQNLASSIDEFLKKKLVTQLYVVGLATDYCVKKTVLDALKIGYEVFIIMDGCKAVNASSGDEQKAVDEMKSKGAQLVLSKELLKK